MKNNYIWQFCQGNFFCWAIFIYRKRFSIPNPSQNQFVAVTLVTLYLHRKTGVYYFLVLTLLITFFIANNFISSHLTSISVVEIVTITILIITGTHKKISNGRSVVNLAEFICDHINFHKIQLIRCNWRGVGIGKQGRKNNFELFTFVFFIYLGVLNSNVAMFTTIFEQLTATI